MIKLSMLVFCFYILLNEIEFIIIVSVCLFWQTFMFQFRIDLFRLEGLFCRTIILQNITKTPFTLRFNTTLKFMITRKQTSLVHWNIVNNK